MSNRALGRLVQELRVSVAAPDAAEFADVELLKRIGTQPVDAGAFEMLVRRHGPMVLGVCRRALRGHIDADDAFQATFLVLLRRAQSLRRPERLAGWLHQVAYRTARRAAARTAHRRERPLADMPAPEPVAELIWRDLRPVFDEELSRLPERYRLPVVLCFLEGRSKREAAEMLGWPEGTVGSRLQRAREILRDRLTRRGLSLSAGVFTVALFQGSAGAAVPTSLAASTIQTAATVSAASLAPAVVLAKGVIQSMFLNKIKIAVLAVAGMLAVGGGAGIVMQSTGGDSVYAADDTAKKPAVPKRGKKSASSTGNDLERLLEEIKAAEADRARAEKQLELLRQRKAAFETINDRPVDDLLRAERERREVERQRAEAQRERAEAERQQADLARKEALAQQRSLQAQIVDLQAQLDATRKQLDDLRAKQESVKAAPDDPQARLKLLEAEVETLRERVAYSQRMLEKGFMSTQQAQLDKAKLAAKEQELANAQTVVGDWKNKLEPTKDKDKLEAVVKQKTNALERSQQLLKSGALSQSEADRMRADLAEARIQLAKVTIRQELQAIVDVRERALDRAQKLHGLGVISDVELERMRQAAEAAHQQLSESK